MFSHINLRPYQKKGIVEVRRAFRSGRHAVLYVLPTGGGKTYTFGAMTQLLVNKGKTVRVLVHRDNLLDQTSESFRKLGIHHGIIQGGRTHIKRQVEIASVYTLANRLGEIDAPDMYIVDEAHHVLANTWKKIFEAHPESKLFGTTATPIRGDGSGLGIKSGGCFEEMILGPTPMELTAMGNLAPFDYYIPPVGADLSQVTTRKNEYNQRQLDKAMNKPTITGCAVSHYRNIAHKEPAIAFCVSKAHAESVAMHFRMAGYNSQYIHDGLSRDQRRAAIRGLADGRIDVLTSCDLISEGTDIPVCSVGILLRPTHSTGLFLQQVGRILRWEEGKVAKILDHVGNKFRHGYPDDERNWLLDPPKKKTRKGESDESDSPSRECDRCHLSHRPQPVCPRCGYVYPPGQERKIKTVDGTLKKVDREALRREKAIQNQSKMRENGRAQSLDQLKAIAEKRGYSDKWVYVMQDQRMKKRLKSLTEKVISMGIKLETKKYSIEDLELLIEEHGKRQLKIPESRGRYDA